MQTGASCKPTILPMGSWPRLIEVAMPYQDSCAARSGTADLLRRSTGATSRYDHDLADYGAAAVSEPARASRVWKRLKVATDASLRRWSHLAYLRYRSLHLQS